MMTRRACVELLGSLVTSLSAFTACKKKIEIAGEESKGREAGSPTAAETEPPTSADWLGFTPYAGARALCNEFVQGFSNGKPMEIHWATFATHDATEDVIALYSKYEKGSLEKEGNSLTVRRGSPVEAVLSVDSSSGKKYHTCINQPRPDEQTIIEVSQVIRP